MKRRRPNEKIREQRTLFTFIHANYIRSNSRKKRNIEKKILENLFRNGLVFSSEKRMQKEIFKNKRENLNLDIKMNILTKTHTIFHLQFNGRRVILLSQVGRIK